MSGMRVPSRFVVIGMLGLSVLAGFGARLALARTRRGLQPMLIAVLLAGVIADGWAVPIPTVQYSPRGRPEDRAVAEWLREAPPGAVLHLPINTYNFQELHYQYATLRHGHPLVNGFSGWSTPLQDLLRQPWAPLYDYDRFASTVAMLRSIGVRYVVVHPADYNVTQLHDGELSNTVGGLHGSGQLSGEKRLMGTYAFTLDPWPDTIGVQEPVEPVPPAEFSIDVSWLPERIRSLTDGNNDSRWFGTGPSWIAARFARPRDLARVELQLAARSLMDYPRELQIDAEDGQGHVRTLYQASPYPEYIAAVLRDRLYPAVRIDLPRNDTTILRLRQNSTHDWSVHELRLWRRP